jgi:3-(3-hydroxy-phenyl)propionate hydroxylase
MRGRRVATHRRGRFGDRLGGRFALVAYATTIDAAARAALAGARCDVVDVGATPEGARAGDRDGHVARRYDMRPGTCYLVRPDQHICARWRALDAAAVRAALLRACARG